MLTMLPGKRSGASGRDGSATESSKLDQTRPRMSRPDLAGRTLRHRHSGDSLTYTTDPHLNVELED